ncbi:hypothetical protein AKJ09_00270 [Labilithrix luteola]|uniref:Uncharacterized protein n=1 Tax=Labilithrix luteola TaxID=1391654 RepID=A0A0K1PJL0_9BACT|nr:hypothetical protein [Labilithrix luteola]AKU93606.1 hypothetical protein AKJ09_00270 [Labilithrix luteola]
MMLREAARAARPGRCGVLFVGLAFVATAIAFGVSACASSDSDGQVAADGGTTNVVQDGSSTSPTGEAAAAAMTPDAACKAYAKARCAKLKSCSDFLFEYAWGNEETCEERQSLGCTDRFTEPGVAMKPADLDTCAKAFASVSCDDLSTRTLPASCTLEGTLAKGATCAHDEQCATGLCKKASFGACGSCDEPSKEGTACSADAVCAVGLVCAGTCTKPAAKGAYCSPRDPCAQGLVCDPDKSRCVQGDPAGTRCADSPSSPDLCDHVNGVVCNPLLMQCEAAKVVAIGNRCNPYSDVCAAGATCDAYGECVPPLAEGDDCRVTGGGPSCFYPAVCELGKCVVPAASACTD